MYKLVNQTIAGNTKQLLVKVYGMLWIPFDPANTDYQEYLKWVAEGNTPESVDESELP